MTKLLIGGSPCTKWSIAQKNNRETEPTGEGWELFRNYLIAKEKFQPDFFLYENNKSAAKPIKDQIAKELGVWDGSIFTQDTGVRFTYLNSALVSAQNRQRFYVTNFGDIEQPEDRGILLRDILESTTEEIGYCIAEPLNDQDGKSRTIKSQYHKTSMANLNYTASYGATMVAEPVTPATVFNVNPSGKGMNGNVLHVNGKCNTLTTNKGEGPKIIEPICVAQRGVYSDTMNRAVKTDAPIIQMYEPRTDGKTNALTTVQKDNMIAEPVSPVRVGEFNKGGQGDRIYSIDGKSVCLSANGGGRGAKTGLYACPIETPACLRYERTDYAKEIRKGYENGTIQERMCNLREWHPRPDGKSNTITSVQKDNMIIQLADGKQHPIYEVRNGFITIKDKQYPIKLVDGFYIIRKLTVTECCRLQTMPDDYCRAVSATQGYKGLGNGWTAEVIIHILKHANIPLDEEIVVLSMYDGIGTGRYCLDKMGYKNVKYLAYEIDKYPIQIAMSNYGDIVQCGDAFQVRQNDWRVEI